MKPSVMRSMLACQFLMMLALEMGNAWLVLLIVDQGDVPDAGIVFWNMLALLLPMAASMVLAPVWGRLSDRFGYRPMLLRATLALLLSQMALLFARGTLMILAIRLLQGMFAGFLAAMQAYALALDRGEARGRLLVRLQSARALATSVAGVTGGALLALGGFRLVYKVATLLCLVAFCWMYHSLPRVDQRPCGERTERPLPRLWNPVLLVPGILIILTQVIRFFPESAYMFTLNARMPGQYLATGLLCSLPAVGLLVSTAWSGRRIDATRACPRLQSRFLLGCAFLGFCSMLIQSLDAGYALTALARLLWGVTLGALLPALFCRISDSVGAQGYAIGMANAFAKAGNLLGVGLGGLAAGLMPLSSLFLWMAALYAVIMVMVREPQVRYKEGLAPGVSPPLSRGHLLPIREKSTSR